MGTDEDLPEPYLTTLSDTIVRMKEPAMEHNPSRQRLSLISPSSSYTFSHIFPGETSQSSFFQKTTLPLVQDALHGQNALLFAYGATNSGKTYTVQGAPQEGSAGILPRTLDVIFNSIKDLHSDGKVR
jgi:kinesin family member 20